MPLGKLLIGHRDEHDGKLPLPRLEHTEHVRDVAPVVGEAQGESRSTASAGGQNSASGIRRAGSRHAAASASAASNAARAPARLRNGSERAMGRGCSAGGSPAIFRPTDSPLGGRQRQGLPGCHGGQIVNQGPPQPGVIRQRPQTLQTASGKLPPAPQNRSGRERARNRRIAQGRQASPVVPAAKKSRDQTGQ